jgi:hypothetical protein
LSLAQQAFVDLKRCEAAGGGGIQVAYKEDSLSLQLGLQGRLCSGASSIKVIDQATKDRLPMTWGLTPYEMTCSAFAVDKSYKEAVRDERCRDFDLAKSFPCAILRRHGGSAAPCVDEWVRNPQALSSPWHPSTPQRTPNAPQMHPKCTPNAPLIYRTNDAPQMHPVFYRMGEVLFVRKSGMPRGPPDVPPGGSFSSFLFYGKGGEAPDLNVALRCHFQRYGVSETCSGMFSEVWLPCLA